jgi:monofunctional biosynthetic peptidoglycan transglycosylase
VSEESLDGEEFADDDAPAHSAVYWLWRGVLILVGLLVVLPVFVVLLYRVVPPPTTPLAIITRLTGGPIYKQWMPLERISPYLVKAVIASEDDKFCSHHGFDWEAIDKAMAQNGRSRTLRGASTISQQTAKNLFLPASRTWIRKGIEAYFTVLLETFWPKRRIIEVYLNVVEWGPQRFGAEAAARMDFGKPAAALNAREAARLAAILPNPKIWRAVNPGPYVAARTDDIVARMGEVTRDRLDACIGR